jgi:RimJ/RimL family protein N-acetyltransferase
MVGPVGFVSQGAGTVELVHGVAPSWRGRGLATLAVRLAAWWLISERGAAIVELRVSQYSPACQRVVVKAGFSLATTVSGRVEATGKVFEDLRYIIDTAEPGVRRRAAG